GCIVPGIGGFELIGAVATFDCGIVPGVADGCVMVPVFCACSGCTRQLSTMTAPNTAVDFARMLALPYPAFAPRAILVVHPKHIMSACG
ncbi:hypothetical protein OAI11_02575, partial [Rhodospirillales bacterium]|nr:hypothetical protein [Rhodospirillales bacterium]